MADNPYAGYVSPEQEVGAPAAISSANPYEGYVLPNQSAAAPAMPQQEVRALEPMPAWKRIPYQVGTNTLLGLADTFVGLPSAGLRALGVSGAPSQQDIYNYLGRRGMAGEASAMPQNEFERGYLVPGVRGAAAAAPFMAIPVGGPLANRAAATMVSGAMGGIAEQQARDAGLSMPEVIGTAAGAVGGGLVSGLARGEAMNAGRASRAWEPYATAGIPPRSAAVTTESQFTRNLLGPRTPLEPQPLRPSRPSIERDLGTAIEDVATQLSPSGARTPQDLGTFAQDRARAWMERPPTVQTPQIVVTSPTGAIHSTTNLAGASPQRVQQAAQAMQAGLPPGHQVQVQSITVRQPPLPNTRAALEEPAWAPINTTMPGTPTPPTDLQAEITRLSGRAGGGALKSWFAKNIDPLINPIVLGRPTTWEDMREVSNFIGDSMKNPALIEGLRESHIDDLWAAAMRDQERAAAARGLGPEFANARKVSNDLNMFSKNVLSKALRSESGTQETIDAGTAGQRLLGTLSRGDSTLAQLRQHGLGDIADEVAATKLRQGGLRQPYSPGSALDPNWHKTWEDLKSAGVHDTLLGRPDVTQRLEAIADLHKRASDIKAAPGGLSEAAGAFAGLAGAAYALAHGYGTEGAILGIVAGHPMRSAAERLISPLWGRYALDPLASSTTLARYAATPQFGTPMTRLLSGYAGANAAGFGNPLLPTDQQPANALAPR